MSTFSAMLCQRTFATDSAFNVARLTVFGIIRKLHRWTGRNAGINVPELRTHQVHTVAIKIQHESWRTQMRRTIQHVALRRRWPITSSMSTGNIACLARAQLIIGVVSPISKTCRHTCSVVLVVCAAGAVPGRAPIATPLALVTAHTACTAIGVCTHGTCMHAAAVEGP